MTSTGDAMEQSAQGIFLSAAVGDALGWPQEVRGGLIGGQKERDRASVRPGFRSWTRYAGHYSKRYRDMVRAGEYSDDTQLLLATARSCLAGERWWERLTEVELPTWPLYQRGGGGAVLTAATSWTNGHPPWHGEGPARAKAIAQRYRGAGANGVAMRIAPHVLWAEDADDLTQRIVRDGITTHGHPRALVGALVYAFTLRHATSSQTTHGFGDSVQAAATGLIDVDRVLPVLPTGWGTPHDLELFAATWQDTNKEVSQLLGFVEDSLHRGAMSNPETTLERLGCTDPKINGAGTVSAAAAIYLASRFAARPLDGLLSAAFLRKADTDTLASLTAAILGALHGADWLGDLASEVQDAAYIAGIAKRCAAHVPSPAPWPTHRPKALRGVLRDSLLSGRNAQGEFPDGRQYRVHDIALLHDGRVLRAWLSIDDGQTVLVDVEADLTAGSGQARLDQSEQPSVESQPAQGRRSDTRRVSAAATQSATPTLRAAPSAQGHPARREVDAILATRSLAKSAAFYARLTGRDVRVDVGVAEIAPGVLLYESATGTLTDASSVIVRIAVDDLSAAVGRLDLDTTTINGHTVTIEVCDPDGRTVQINQRDPRRRPER